MQARLTSPKNTRHQPPVNPMDVAFLVPEANEMDETAAGRGSSSGVILRVLLGQFGVGAVLAAVFWGLHGYVAGYSALLGGLASAIPNAFLASRLVVPRRDPGARGLLRAAWVGELGKLVLTALIFGAVFVLVRPLAPAALFAGFIGAQLVVFAGLALRHD